MFHNVFKAAGWMAGTAAKCVPVAFNTSVKAATFAANTVVGVNTAVTNAGVYTAGRVAGHNGAQAASMVASSNQSSVVTTAKSVAIAGNIATGKQPLADILKLPLNAAFHSVMRH